MWLSKVVRVSKKHFFVCSELFEDTVGPCDYGGGRTGEGNSTLFCNCVWSYTFQNLVLVVIKHVVRDVTVLPLTTAVLWSRKMKIKACLKMSWAERTTKVSDNPVFCSMLFMFQYVIISHRWQTLSPGFMPQLHAHKENVNINFVGLCLLISKDVYTFE